MKWTFFCVFLVIHGLLELANFLPENYSVQYNVRFSYTLYIMFIFF